VTLGVEGAAVPVAFCVAAGVRTAKGRDVLEDDDAVVGTSLSGVHPPTARTTAATTVTENAVRLLTVNT
jgi:hypothetical protein